MDFSVFASPDFDPVAWINDTLAQPRQPGESLLQTVSNLRMKIQVVSMGMINSLDELSAQSVSRIPRVLRDIDILRKDAIQLRAHLQEQESLISQLEGDTSRSIAELAELDQLKSRIQEMSRIVAVADRFKTLIKTFETSNEQQEISVLANALQEIHESYSILKNLPEFKQYSISVATYTERLEGQLRPKLLSAFANHSTPDALECVRIYRQIGRMEEVHSLYYKNRVATVLKIWNDYDAVKVPLAPGQPIPPPAVPFTKWLPTFYNELLHLLNTEAPWLISVFPEPGQLISSLLLECLRAINESYEQRLTPLNLEQLIQAYTVTRQFSENVNPFLSSSGPTKSFQVKGAIFHAYRPLQARYAQLERAFITRDIAALKPSKGDFMSTISILRDSVQNLFLLAETCLNRCLTFTAGCEAEALSNSVLQVILDDYLGHFKTLVVQMRQVAGLEPAAQSDSLKKKLTATDGEVFHDWKESFFQGALQILEISNNVEYRLQTFIESLCARLIQQKSKLFASRRTSSSELEFVDAADPILQSDHTKARRVLTFFESLADSSTRSILVRAEKSVQQLILVSQRFVFDTMFSYVKEKLAYVPSFDEWSKGGSGGGPVLNFSLTPLGYVKLIVEHLLVLPQVLEPYDQNSSLERIDVEELRHSVGVNAAVDALLTGEDEDKTLEKSSGFASQWIAEVTRATQALYLTKMFEIPFLSGYGSAQLATDISHLFNVLTVLGAPHLRPLEVAQISLKASAAQFPALAEKFSESNDENVYNRIKSLRKL